MSTLTDSQVYDTILRAAMMTGLKPCPFCKGEAQVWNGGRHTIGHGETEHKTIVGCKGCPARMETSGRFDAETILNSGAVILAWNTREGELDDGN